MSGVATWQVLVAGISNASAQSLLDLRVDIQICFTLNL